MICELVRQGKTVGITANSHKVIRNLIDETIKAADEQGIELQCCHKADVAEPAQHRLTFAKRSEDLIAALGHGVAGRRRHRLAVVAAGRVRESRCAVCR